MAQTHRNRWQTKRTNQPPGMSAKGVYWNRAIFTVLALALLVALIKFLIRPVYPPQNLPIYVTGPSQKDLDAIALPLPSPPLIKGLDQPIQIDELENEIRNKIKTDSETIGQNTLVIYVTADGYVDPKDGPCLIVSVDDAAEPVKSMRKPVGDFLTSVLESSQRIGTVLVVFDCSRTFKTPRWGWTSSGGFTEEKLKPIVDEINENNGSRLWVICATDGKRGISQREQSFPAAFEKARDKSIGESSRKDSRVTVDLFFRELVASTRELYGEQIEPFLISPANSDEKAAEKSPGVAWYPTKTEKDTINAAAKAESEKLKKKETAAKEGEAPAGKVADDRPVVDTNLEDIDQLWRLCDELEAFHRTGSKRQSKEKERGKNVAGKEGGDPVEDADAGDQTDDEFPPPDHSPLLFEPHLWRRLKAELVAMEFHRRAGRKPESLDRFELVLNELKTWEFKGGKGSEKVFDILQKVGQQYFRQTNRKENPFEDRQMAGACRAYAEALFVMVELIQLEDRLASVNNADRYSFDQQDFDKGVRLLRSFFNSAFAEEHDPPVAAAEIADVIETGKKLTAWTQDAVKKWMDHGQRQQDEASKAAKHAVAWVTLDVLLTSGLWSAETRASWRDAQNNWNGKTIGLPPRRTDAETKLESRLGDLAEIIQIERPKGSSRDELRSWLIELKDQVKTAKEPRQKHFLATLCDQRDWTLGDQPIRIGRPKTAAPPPERIWLELVKEEVAQSPPVAKEGEKPVTESASKVKPFSLDEKEETVEVRVKVVRESGDGKSLPARTVTLKAMYNKQWLMVEDSDQVKDSKQQVPLKDGEAHAEVLWTVRMAKDRVRQSSKEVDATLPFRVDFADSYHDEIKREPELKRPKLEPATEDVPITLRNQRAVVLACGDAEVSSPADPQPRDGKLYEIKLRAVKGDPPAPEWKYSRATEWNLTNQSPIDVKAKLSLFRIPKGRNGEWPWHYGELPVTKQLAKTELFEWYEETPPKTLVAEAEVELKEGAQNIPVPWKMAGKDAATPAAATGPQDVTHGLCCEMQIDQDSKSISWIQMLPVPPADELRDKPLNAKVDFYEDGGAKFTLPAALNEIPPARYLRDGKWTLGLLDEFKTKPNGYDIDVFVDLHGWPRALYWRVPVVRSGESVAQKSGESRRVRFRSVSFPQGQPEVVYDQIPSGLVPSEKLRVEEWPVDVDDPLIFQYVKDKQLKVVLEADAASTDFKNLSQECAELRLEEVDLAGERSTSQFKRRADRQWKTTCAIPADKPMSLVFESSISDFEIAVEPKPGLVRLRASFYLGAKRAEEQTIPLFFDRAPPKVQLGVANANDGKINLNVSWSDDGDPLKKGVKEIRFWLSDTDAPKGDPVETLFWDGTPGEDRPVSLPTTQIEKKARDKRYRVIARAKDHSGRESRPYPTDDFDLPQIRDPMPAADGQPKDKPSKKKDGVIRGQLLTPNGKIASDKSFKVELRGGDRELDDNTKNGIFEFTNLDPDIEYSISVPSRQYGAVGRLELPEKKMKPKPPNSNLMEKIKLQKEK